jgi:molybdenum-dependent DNA-binding transcriptional regulator ModE
MTGHGEKLSRRQEQAIAALLAQPSIAGAAKAVGIGEKTLWRWLQREDFEEAYQIARRRVVDQAIARVQAGMAEAVQTLRSVMNNKKTAASARVSAARAMIGFGFEAVQMEDLEKRIAALEAHTGTK